MQLTSHPLLLIALLGAVSCIVALPIVWKMGIQLRPSARGLMVSAFPSLAMLILFYSLAFHMYRALGSWPTSIGERGFPGPLLIHALIATDYAIALGLVTVLGGPILLLMFISRPAWRAMVRYLFLHVGFLLSCWMLMQLAPNGFLYWWRD